MPEEFTEAEKRDLVDAAIARDKRYATIARATDIDREIATSKTLGYIFEKADEARNEALEKLATAPAQDQNAIRTLQQRAQIGKAIKEWLAELANGAHQAEEDIKAEDGLLPGDDH